MCERQPSHGVAEQWTQFYRHESTRIADAALIARTTYRQRGIPQSYSLSLIADSFLPTFEQAGVTTPSSLREWTTTMFAWFLQSMIILREKVMIIVLAIGIGDADDINFNEASTMKVLLRRYCRFSDVLEKRRC